MSWSFLSKIIAGLKRPETSVSGEGVEHTSDYDDSDSKPIIVKLVVMIRKIQIKNLTMVTTLRPGIQQINICSVFLRLPTTGAALSVLL